MKLPPIDIIVPVWNYPFETRACLAAVLEHSAGARLIVVDYGSSRETELMLEEFSESLGDQGLFIKSEKNVGLVAALNLGLASATAGHCVILRPNVMVRQGWLQTLAAVARSTGASVISPIFTGPEAPSLQEPPADSDGVTETGQITFNAIFMDRTMLAETGCFDEMLDGGEWCLREFLRRIADKGYRCFVTSRLRLFCDHVQELGSLKRRSEMVRTSRLEYIARWGVNRSYALYFGSSAPLGTIEELVPLLLDGARQGHRFSLLLHFRQYALSQKKGWNTLHTGIEFMRLSLFLPLRDIERKIRILRSAEPDIVMVSDVTAASFAPPGGASISLETLKQSLCDAKIDLKRGELDAA